MIKINLHGEIATLWGPFPAPLVRLIGGLSGRKKWEDGHVEFEATPNNICTLCESDYSINWVDPQGLLDQLLEFHNQPTQKDAHALALDYEPGMPLMKHQLDTLSISRDRACYAHLHEMGLGKTAIMITEAALLFKKGLVTGVLILAPKGVHRQWATEQIPQHIGKGVSFSCMVWGGAKPPKIKLYPGLSFYMMNTDAIRTKKGYDNAVAFLKLHPGKSMMIVDESHLIKNHSAQRTRQAWALGEMCAYRRIATGTPMSKNIIDAWSQFKFLDYRILGHKYVTSFRSKFCVMGGFEGKQIIGQKNTEEFQSLIAPHSYRLTKKEALDLPPKQYATREYDMSEVTRRHYRDMKELFMTQLDNGEIADVPNAAVCLLRLQQIVCGYLPVDDTVHTISHERIHSLIEIVEQVEGPVVIWARFIEDIHRIRDALKQFDSRARVVTYYGATGQEERELNKQQFLEGRARFFISNPAAGGTGLNLQGSCQNVIYYSNSFDALHRWQSEDRTHRLGTTKPVTYFDLVAVGSIDRLILRNLKIKKSLSSLTLDEIRSAIGGKEL